MWPSAPRLFLHEFLKPREEIKESLQAKTVFEYQSAQLFILGPLYQQQ
jgi:hypothetical protein